MTRHQHLAIASLFLFGVASTTIGAERNHYAIKLNGKIIGYASTDFRDAKNSKFAELHSTTVLKLALLGKQRITKLTSTTYYGRKTESPVRYQLKSQINQVVQQVECQIEGTQAKRWAYKDATKKGQARELPLPKQYHILGSNNFGHWQKLSASLSKNSKQVSVDVFLPDGGQTTKFNVRKGEKRDLVINGKKRRCESLHLSPGDVILWNEQVTNQFVRMDLPSQKTTIELADVNVIKLFQRSEAAEVLANRFVKPNIHFDDFMKVTSLRAEVSAVVQGVTNPASVLNTRTQTFTGKLEKSRVTGAMAIKSVPYNGKRAPAFPYKGDDLSALQRWLKPSTYIESDDQVIQAKSKELVKGAKDSWDATQQIGRWVQKEISYTIADTPSARLALDKKCGDCGPHSTLTIAMLRAAGIPARLVGGLLYSPVLGGTFGQHAWVEVYMGKDGWIAIDPTSGEFQQMSAVHIKLFEGLGGVLPEKVKVISFTPPNRKISTTARKARPMTWKLKKEHVYEFIQNGKTLGTETFTITKAKQGKETVYSFNSKLKLKINFFTSVSSQTKFSIAANGKPLAFEREYTAPRKVSFKSAFKKDSVETAISLGNRKATAKLPADALMFDNNLLSSFAGIFSQLTLKPGKEIKIATYHPSSTRILNLTMKVGEKLEKVNGEECYKCDVLPIRNTFFVTKDGRFIKAVAGKLVIQLKK